MASQRAPGSVAESPAVFMVRPRWPLTTGALPCVCGLGLAPGSLLVPAWSPELLVALSVPHPRGCAHAHTHPRLPPLCRSAVCILGWPVAGPRAEASVTLGGSSGRSSGSRTVTSQTWQRAGGGSGRGQLNSARLGVRQCPEVAGGSPVPHVGVEGVKTWRLSRYLRTQLPPNPTDLPGSRCRPSCLPFVPWEAWALSRRGRGMARRR